MSESNINKLAEGALSHEELLSILTYNSITGVFTWRIQPCKNVLSGSVAGTEHSKLGYTTISYKGFRYQAHRLAWFYVHNMWPEGVIDHIDRNPRNNKISNLRSVSQSVNMHNARLRNDNESGCKGVSYMRLRGCWRCRINVAGKEIHIGVFHTKEQAIKARNDAEQRYLV